jgi:aminoglycoside phosphotransferase (APT) family kinase protein
VDAATVGAVVTWLRVALGARDVEPVGPVAGSTTASGHAFRVRGVRGARGVESAIPVLVKVYDHDVPGVDGSHFVFAEGRGLTAAEQAGIPAPRLVAIDTDGSRAGRPAVAMTVLRGEVRPRPTTTVEDWVWGLASELVRIANAPRPAIELPLAESWREPASADDPPGWITDPAVWRAAVERVDSGLVGSTDGFIHRDYHPLNVLWHDDEVTGVVDWVNACEGPIEFDLSRCRVNVALAAGPEAADAFLTACGDLGRDYDRAWDLETVFSLLGDVDVLLAGNAVGAGLTPASIRTTLAAVVTDAVRS